MLFPCFYKALFGINCPVCGFQRSFILLYNGYIVDSFKMYPPLIPSLLLIILFILYILKKELIRKKYLNYYSIIVLIIIAINYISEWII